MKSFIPWIGGKSQLRKQILEQFPKHTSERYIEVFGGAGWVLFAKEKHAKFEVFNDFDGQLINLYRCIQYHCTELLREIKLGGQQIMPNSRQMFTDYKEQLHTVGLTDIQKAARYYYIIRTSYGADKKSYGCSVKSLENSLALLPDIQKRLQTVVIENRDFAAIIKTYDRVNALFYLDPPYYRTENYYDGFTTEDHVRLKNRLECIKGRFVLSYNDDPYIRELYKDYNIVPVVRTNNLAHKYKEVTTDYHELIIKNY